MLTVKEREKVYEFGYLPEHLVDYVESVTLSAPFIHESFLVFFKNGHLIFIGYPLGPTRSDLKSSFESSLIRFDPATVSIMAPDLWMEEAANQAPDHYYALDLPITEMDGDNAYMLRRAARELTIRECKAGRDHKKLIGEFLSHMDFDQAQRNIYESIPRYLKRSKSATLIEARKDNTLVAFNILDLGTADYGFYMFNIRSNHIHVPGASDLLLWEIAQLSHKRGKKRLNLGLGVNRGIRRFKEKWGGKPTWSHKTLALKIRDLDLMSLF
jgi:hypothetical protein